MTKLHGAYPQVFVTDMPRAVDFYVKTLGFAVVYLYGEPAFYGEVTRDGAHLNLRHVDVLPSDAAMRDRESLLTANVPVDGVEALFADLQSRGAIFAQTLTRQPWGATDFIVRDPDGNLLCFASTTA